MYIFDYKEEIDYHTERMNEIYNILAPGTIYAI